MNTNQLKLNIMEGKEPKSNFNKTQLKYEQFLKELKYETEINNVKSLSLYSKKYGVNNFFTTFLIKNNVLFKNENGFYKWNEKIPISIKLISKFRIFAYEANCKCREKNKFVKPKEKTIVNYKPKLKTPIVKNNNEPEIGLIRKFLKWIY
jgi:hypothetical protein